MILGINTIRNNMLFKEGDVLEYNNGYYGIIKAIVDDDIFLDLSDGSHFYVKKNKWYSKWEYKDKTLYRKY